MAAGQQQFATANGTRIVTASLSIPLYGIPVCDLLVPTLDPLTTPVSVVFGNFTQVMGVYRQGYFGGSQYARLVGGYAGWRNTVSSQAYNNPSGINLSLVLGDAAAAVGEQVNVATDSSVGTFYVRENAAAQRLLRQLGGPLWWVDPTGVTQVGPRTPVGITTPFTVISYDAAQGLYDIATEDYASWMPANTFSGPTLTTGITNTISLTRLTVDNDGILRLKVLGSP